MKVALIGGMDRLEQHYLREAKKLGHEMRVFNRFESGLPSRIGKPEAFILFTGKVSHQVRAIVTELAKTQGVPLYQYHQCGICALRDALMVLNQSNTASAGEDGCLNCRN